ncbi:alpha/beta hydrolase [Petrocella sp. FN5]|uniref:alpha/beta hydrolase n=1 Tax=Petrocella sp. FN5 TaxID=3032002 RepID=UPI0023DC7FF3|nr:alpha/beta hydrolase [Petrocella sp. FN5]MDF1616618.1 alpha/beta hydrolase [Petrocella sp. FN5]
MMKRLGFLTMALTGAYGVLSYHVYKNVAKPQIFTHEEAYDFDIKQGSYNDILISSMPKEAVMIPSSFGYDLFAYWIPYKGATKTVILSHGITSNIFGALKYFQLYYDLGFNIIAYDHRNHGESGGRTTTHGYYEKHDLEDVVCWVREKVGSNGIIGTHGESMGASIALQHIATYDNLDFVVADCPYADLLTILKYRIKVENKLPVWLGLYGASIINRLMGQGFYQDVSPISEMKHVHTPVLFIHGAQDHYIPYEHSVNLYEHKLEGVRELYLSTHGDHANSIIVDNEHYTDVVYDFLKQIGLKK